MVTTQYPSGSISTTARRARAFAFLGHEMARPLRRISLNTEIVMADGLPYPETDAFRGVFRLELSELKFRLPRVGQIVRLVARFELPNYGRLMCAQDAEFLGLELTNRFEDQHTFTLSFKYLKNGRTSRTWT